MEDKYKDITLRFKIVGFTYFPGEQKDINDCLAVTEDGEHILVDPFVGCAFKYESAEHLLNEWWEGTGFFTTGDDIVFLPSEGKFHKIEDK